MKTMKKVFISMIAVLLLFCVYVPESKAAITTPARVKYGTGTKAVISKNSIAIGEKSTMKVKMKADDKNYKDRTLIKVSYKSLSPDIATVKKNSAGKGIVIGKKAGTVKIKVYTEYICKEKCYTKCVNQKPKTSWVKRTFKETTYVTLKVHGTGSNIIPSEPVIVPVVGGSVRLHFEVDGAPYASPLTVGVGIVPTLDYADKFPPAPEKQGYLFAGWYTKDNVKIGTTAQEIYPAFDLIQSGQEATVHAVWQKIDETIK